MPQTTEQEQKVRRVVAEALDALAFALAMCALLVFALMFAVWVRDRPTYDFPGRYLFAAFPLLLAALILNIRADRIRKGA